MLNESLGNTESRRIRGDMRVTGTTLVESHVRTSQSEQGETGRGKTGERTSDSMSVVSNDQDIASRAPRKRSGIELLTVKDFSAFFAEQDELHVLHEELLDKLGSERFIENYRKCLKEYVLRLREEAQTPLERDTVEIIESHQNRRSMAIQILHCFDKKRMAPESSLKTLDSGQFRGN